jgi:FtsP/CotA-like multicopper oxidase with cupredoxin domain
VLFLLAQLLFGLLLTSSLVVTAQAADGDSTGYRVIVEQAEPVRVSTQVADTIPLSHQGMPGMETVEPNDTMTSTMGEMDHDMTSMDDHMPSMDHDMAGMSAGEAMTGSMGDMGGHGMEPVPSDGVPVATETTGAQPLDYMLDGDTKVFTLTAKIVQWPIKDNVTMTAYTYNGIVPGPLLRVTEGDKVRIVLKNELPAATTVHWHGILVPNSMDGVSGVTQDAIEAGATFTYEFVAKPAGSFMYHSHTDSDSQVGLGLYAPFIIDPVQPEAPAPDVDVVMMLSEARVVNGQTFESMPMAGAEPNYFLINGKAFPATETISVKKGDRVRIRFMGIGQFVHPMHLHGLPFKIVATDGYPVPEAAQLTKDTVLVSPGERYDVEFVASETGQWVLHCHILHHTTNDGVEPGGLMMMFDVTE